MGQITKYKLYTKDRRYYENNETSDKSILV